MRDPRETNKNTQSSLPPAIEAMVETDVQTQITRRRVLLALGGTIFAGAIQAIRMPNIALAQSSGASETFSADAETTKNPLEAKQPDPNIAKIDVSALPDASLAIVPIDKVEHLVAGGEFIDPQQLQNTYFQYNDSPGFFSSKALDLLRQDYPDIIINTSSSKQLTQLLNTSRWAPLFTNAPVDKGSVIFVEEKVLFVFQSNPNFTSTTVFCVAPEKTWVVSDRLAIPPYHAPTNLRWLDSYGVVVEKDGIVTHQYNLSTQSFDELDKYRLLGTPRQRMGQRLSSLYDLTLGGRDGNRNYQNPLGISSDEIKQFMTTGDDTGLNTFQILRNKKGDPLIVLATAPPPYGLRQDIRYVEYIKQAIQRLNEVDETIVDTLANRFYLRGIAGDTGAGYFSGNPTYNGYTSTYLAQEGLDLLNDVTPVKDANPINFIAVIMMETRGLYSRHHFIKIGDNFVVDSKDRFSDNEGVDKGLWFKDWTERNKTMLTSDEYKRFVTFANGTVDYYQKNS